MTKINPILPLAVQIAEGRGQFAFFLGSGVSRPAGIPSGWCVRQHTLKDLYRMQENVEKINENAFEKWLEYTGFVLRNSDKEVAELPPLLENELREIFNRYGLVVMGYGAYEKE